MIFSLAPSIYLQEKRMLQSRHSWQQPAALSLLPFISITGGNVMQLHQACLLVWANLGLDYKHRHRNHLIPFQSDLENNTELFIEPAATATSPIGSAWLSLDGER